jgi:AmmeMemoRadiSam system protein B/AmmeMemoRadiSam system protein A
MRSLLSVMLLITGTMNILSQNRSADRDPVVAGSFYSANKETLTNDLATLFAACVKAPSDLKVRAIISPHAGYVFSGKISASAFSALQKNAGYKNIFIIGSSHVMAFDGASVYNTGDFITPLGKMKVNIEIANKIKNENKHFNFPVTAHLREHSIEVQIPFIQYCFKNDISIVPIIIGTDDKKTIKEIAAALKPYFFPENLFVISSDFSHYPSYKDAQETDKTTADVIVAKNSEYFLRTLDENSSKGISGLVTSMCGWTSGLTLLYLAEGDPRLIFRKISYCNSGDSQYGEKNKVVGYHAIELVEENKKSINVQVNQEELKFTKEESEKLISIARNSIRAVLFDNKRPTINPENLPSLFKLSMGAFVTLKIDGNLRGCIGRFTSPDPLYQVVSQMAQSSAFEDSRFSPLTKAEFEKTEIEISVLGPLKKINNINEIVPGKHGIYIKKDSRSGTMLPQVATENHWTVEEFLGYTAREKAGIGWTGWKDAEIYIYEAVVLEENKK